MSINLTRPSRGHHFWMALLAILISVTCVQLPSRSQPVAFEGCQVDGLPVLTVEDPAVNDIAVALRNPATGYPEIRYNRAVATQLSYRTRLFVYFHECAHHRLGHTLGYGRALPLVMEQQADCWAIRQLYGKYLNAADLSALQQDLRFLSQASPTHFSGPQRARNLRDCLNYR